MAMVKRHSVVWRDRGVVDVVDAADYDALAARLAEAERDAARWRWFRTMADRIAFFTATDTHENVTRVERLDVFPLRSFPLIPDSVDNAFDVAIADSADEDLKE